MLCICGSNVAQASCCSSILSGNRNAETAEQLMRSRYYAYAHKNAQYIYDTYAEKTQKELTLEELSAWAEQATWRRLEVHPKSSITKLDTLTPIDEQLTVDYVRFSAFYVAERELHKMTETSRFIFTQERWFYLDGNIEESVTYTKLKRNASCPCNSGKKFKQCCMNYI